MTGPLVGGAVSFARPHSIFSLLTLTSSLKLDLDAALEKVITKMRDRLERTGQLGSGS
jgi:hypothetical protein